MKLSELVANDDGSSYNKVAYYKKVNGKLTIETARYPTNIQNGVDTTHVYTDHTGTNRVYSVNGETYTITPNKDGYDTRTHDHQFSNGIIAMNQFALESSGFGGKTVVCINGLPVQNFFSGANGSRNEEVVKRKETAFRTAKILNSMNDKGHAAETDSSRLVTIKKAITMPEAVGAYYDMLFSDTGEVNGHIHGDVIIVDMGSYTTDICLVDAGHEIDAKTIRTLEDKGFLWVYDNFKRKLSTKGFAFDPYSIPKPRLEEALRTGYLKTTTQQTDVREVADEVIKECLTQIVNTLKITLKDRMHFVDTIIAVGGGAFLVKKSFGDLTEAVVVPENPQFSNAKGFLKLVVWGSGAEIEDDL